MQRSTRKSNCIEEKGDMYMYMTVEDLNREQLNELKEIYFLQLKDCDEDVLGDVTCAEEIPDEVIFNHFGGVMFAEEYFY